MAFRKFRDIEYPIPGVDTEENLLLGKKYVRRLRKN